MGEDRDRPCAAVPLPPGLDALLAGYRWSRNLVGESGGAVYRLHGRTESPDLYMKHGAGAVADAVVEEFARLRWLGRHVRVPDVVQFQAAPGEAWLVMTALPGQTAWQAMNARPDDRNAIVDALADFLSRLHSVPVAACPFSADAMHLLMLAGARIDAGLVDAEDFDDDRNGWTAEQVWQAIHALPPLPHDPVVTHGDYSLDNVLMTGTQIGGCIDVGRAGIADRYQDLAIAWNCLAEFGERFQTQFLDRYGIDKLDRSRLDFHLMLDELF